jgi:3-hydroxyacyl-[acyl-carrier-protein] dehydratase
MRFHFLDRILEIETGKRARGVKQVTNMDEFLLAHYPLRPVMPGTLLLETIAQLGGWLHVASTGFRSRTVMGLLQNARLHREVVPGDRLIVEARIVYAHRDGAELTGSIHADGALIAEVGRLMFVSETTRDEEFARISRERLRYLTGDLRILQA